MERPRVTRVRSPGLPIRCEHTQQIQAPDFIIEVILEVLREPPCEVVAGDMAVCAIARDALGEGLVTHSEGDGDIAGRCAQDVGAWVNEAVAEREDVCDEDTAGAGASRLENHRGGAAAGGQGPHGLGDDSGTACVEPGALILDDGVGVALLTPERGMRRGVRGRDGALGGLSRGIP